MPWVAARRLRVLCAALTAAILLGALLLRLPRPAALAAIGALVAPWGPGAGAALAAVALVALAVGCALWPEEGAGEPPVDPAWQLALFPSSLAVGALAAATLEDLPPSDEV